MSNVQVSIKMSPKAAGALYMKSLKQDERIAALEKERDFILSKVGFDNGGFYLPCGNGRTDKEESIKNIKEALKEKG